MIVGSRMIKTQTTTCECSFLCDIRKQLIVAKVCKNKFNLIYYKSPFFSFGYCNNGGGLVEVDYRRFL